MSRNPASTWTPAFTTELSESLIAFTDMHDLDWRQLVLRGTGERLGLQGSFPVATYSDPYDHIFAIVSTCRTYKDPPSAVTALVGTIEQLRPNDRALVRLRDCRDSINGLSALGAPLLHAVLKLIDEIPSVRRDVNAYELAMNVRIEGEGVPLLPFEDLLVAVQKLDNARQTVSVEVPLVVRFLTAFSNMLDGQDKTKLTSLIDRIITELSLPPDAARAILVPRKVGRKVLRIRLNDISTAKQYRYTVEGAVFDVTPDYQRRTNWVPPDQVGFLENDLKKAGDQFLSRAKKLTGAIGSTTDPMVEFLLPWRLLGSEVEQWHLDGSGYRICDRFVVVARSLDRQQEDTFFGVWQNRWELLCSPSTTDPVSEQIGWLYHGNTLIPENAGKSNRVVSMNGRHGNLTQWLEKADNCETVSLGLTFAYRADDPVALHSVKEAFNEGIPVLLWRRDNGDVNELEKLLKDVSIKDLPERVQSWRRSTANHDDSTNDARYHIVLLWDDPSNIEDPAKYLLTRPRQGE